LMSISVRPHRLGKKGTGCRLFPARAGTRFCVSIVHLNRGSTRLGGQERSSRYDKCADTCDSRPRDLADRRRELVLFLRPYPPVRWFDEHAGPEIAIDPAPVGLTARERQRGSAALAHQAQFDIAVVRGSRDQAPMKVAAQKSGDASDQVWPQRRRTPGNGRRESVGHEGPPLIFLLFIRRSDRRKGSRPGGPDETDTCQINALGKLP